MSNDAGVIPSEFEVVYNSIPQNERESFQFTLQRYDKFEHFYVKLLDVILETIEVYATPSPYWLFMVGKICFTGAQYDRLIELRTKEKYKNDPSLKIFEARVLTYRGQFEQAEKQTNEVLSTIEMDLELNLSEILLFFEGNFSLGLTYTFSRQFDKLQATIDELSKHSSKYKIKKNLDNHYLDMIYYEHILKVSLAFNTGKIPLMREELLTMKSFIENLQDPWKKGYYFNLYGISNFQIKDMKEGENSLKQAYEYFKTVNDLRGFTAVGANLGISYITQGLSKEGRKYIEDVLDPMVKLQNYSFAIAFMLQLSKSYLTDKDEENAKRMLEWAEQTSLKGNIVEPATYSLSSYFYSRMGNIVKSDHSLEELYKMTHLHDSEKKEDAYTLQWYYTAASVNALVKGELKSANDFITNGITLAEKNNNHDFILESTQIKLEILLRRFLLEERDQYIEETLALIEDLSPLLSTMDNPYYEATFFVMAAYLNQSLGKSNAASTYIAQAIDKAKDNEDATQNHEIKLYNKRVDFLEKANPRDSVPDPIYDDFIDNWLSDIHLKMIYTLETLRLLTDLQFHKANLGAQVRQADITPSMLLIVAPTGITLFSHKFEGSGTNIDEILVGGFLSAITSFSKELFGGGQLSRIDQDNFMLLIERSESGNFVVLIVEKETYTIRRKFKKFISELTMTHLLNYLSSDQFLSESDPQYVAIRELILQIFGA